jgi:predicted nucleic acid-binding protein
VILVDTSVWIDHFRSTDPVLVAALEAGEVLMHPFILGELACGNLHRRQETLELLNNLPTAPVATGPVA